MFERLTKQIKTTTHSLCRGLWCHRATYAALALAYGLTEFGVLEKEMLTQIVTGLYLAMTAQRR